MVKRGVVVSLLLIAVLGIAHATHPGSESLYDLLGFTADGKYVHFTKKSSSGPFEDHWHAVYDAATTKLTTSQPVYRDCGGVECDKPTIDKKVGAATTAQLVKKYGAPVGGSLVPPKGKSDPGALRKAVQTPAGAVQDWAATGLDIKTTSRLLGKFPDISDGNRRSVQVELEIVVTVKGATSTVKHKLYADPIEDPNNGNILLWPELYVQQIAVSPDRKTVAFVFARKPFVIKPK